MEDVQLTEEQKKIALENVGQMNLSLLTKLVFKDESLDGRSDKGKALKAFLASQGKEIKTTKYEKLPDFELTEENKEFIQESVRNKNSRPIELARIVTQNPKLPPNSKEFRAVYDYIKLIDANQTDISDEQVEKKEYKPPQNVTGMAAKINAYVPTSDPKKPLFNPNNLKPAEDKRCKTLMGHLKSERFIYQASSYDKKIDRTLFESEFIRFTYDKEDLPPTEVGQFISLCAEIVNESQTNRILSIFQSEVEAGLKSSDEETRRYSVSLAENLNAWRAKAEASKKQQNQLLDKLTESRSKRLDGKMNENSSVLTFLDMWIKEESRAELIELGKREKQEDKDEVKRIKDFDDVISLLAGQTEEEASL